MNATTNRCCCLLLLLTGCITPLRKPTYVKLPFPPSEQIRDEFGTGTVAVVASSVETETKVERPLGKGQSSLHAAAEGFWIPLLGTPGGGGIFIAPVTTVIGAISGAIAGVSQKEYAQLCTNLTRIASSVTQPVALQQRIVSTIPHLTPHTALCASNLISTGTASALELATTQFEFGGPRDIDPPMWLRWVVSARLIRLTDNHTLTVLKFTYDGNEHRLKEWAANDGALFRAEIQSATDQMASAIVERVFLVYPLPHTPAQERVFP